jgi:Fur family transcriptional regulator, ferric uptake regulator
MGVVHGATAAQATDLSSVEAVLELIRETGGRATTSRRTLLEVLFEGSGHHSAEELAAAVKARAPDVHLSTVYRNLEELERLGVIVHAHLGHGPVTYQLARHSHAHFVCENCGRRVDVPEQMFRGLAQSARKSYGFEIDPRHQAIMGWCAACSSDRD